MTSKFPARLATLCLLAAASAHTHAYTYITCANGNNLDFNGGHMTFNYADNLAAAQKAAISLGHARLTAFSDTSITTVDNNDNNFYSGNGQNEIYLDNSVSTASCSYWFYAVPCTVAEADMQYGNQPWTTTDNSQHYPYAVGRSMTGTAIHEGGHCVGMAHTSNLANMMGAEYSYVTRQGIDAYYGPGEDLSDGLLDLHGEKSGGLDTHRDVGVTVMRYAGSSGQYSLHDFGVLRDQGGTALPVAGSYVGQPAYHVGAGATIQMEIMLENNGEADTEVTDVGFYLSGNDIISATDTLLGTLGFTLGRDGPLQTTATVTIPAATAPGNYFLGAYADHLNLIPETTVANNAAYYPITVVGPVPTVTTDPASAIAVTAATLNATINPNGLATTLHFDYGTTAAFGSTATYGSVGSGAAPVSAGAPVSGLTCGTLYYFRARGVSSAGTGMGANGTFTTGQCPAGC